MLWLLVAVPLLAGGALLLAGRRADRFAAPIGIMAAVIALGTSITVAARRPAVSASYLDGVSFGLNVDGLSAVMVITVSVVLVAVLVFAAGEPELNARFHGLMLVFAGAMLVTVTATTFVTLLMAWEVMGAASYALIGYWWRESRRASSGTVAFLTTRGADLGLYLAAGAALAGGAASLGLGDLASLPDGWRDVVAAGVVLAALGKSAQFPFSFWLSRAMDGPSPVSALLHSATMVAAGGYLLLRLQPLLGATPWAAAVVAWGGALTALLLGAVAVAQTDLKQLLAASTCAQVGFMVLAAGTAGVAAGTGQLVAHALTKSVLFLCAGAWLTALGAKTLPALRGVARRFPVVGISFTVAAVALAGVPPLSIWATKDHVLANAWHESTPLYLVGLAAAALSAAYAARAVALVWAREPNELPGQVTRWHQAALPPLAAGAALLGVLAVPTVWQRFAEIVSVQEGPSPSWWELLVSGVVALAVAGAVAVFVDKVPAPAALRGWLGLETAARTLVAKPLDATANALARFDDRVVDGGVRTSAALGAAFARVVDNRVEWTVDGLVRGLARMFRALGRLARRPQTGQLHHYYAQAVVALAVLAVLLLMLSNGR
ncbi:proton-conducting transporter membrane subunit [Actinophytocola sp.]|uniref:proton-conducting transporter transmembrane domain-containing protein n=1 Tax=Actinophytocola sp. TaxID=1872138 RepID=UPI002ED41A01